MSYVLLIEDNQNNADMMIRLLETVGYTVRHYIQGFDAMKAARKEHPSIILVDFNLPDIDGTDVVLLLKQQLGGAKAPPIIAVTARASSSDEKYALRMGCDAFVTKPINPQAFLDLVNSFHDPATT